MSKPKSKLTMAQWKEMARDVLKGWTNSALNKGQSISNKVPSRPRIAGKKVVFVVDPIKITFDDDYGGNFTCTYDIRRTLASLSKRFQELEEATEDEITAYASSENISFDEAMARLAFRYVEAEIFSKLKAGRFLYRLANQNENTNV